MVRNYKPKNRPSHICSRGPYRPRRRYLEELKRLDTRDYIKLAKPDVDEEDSDEDSFDLSILGYAEIDPRDPKYTYFIVKIKRKGRITELQMYRGSPLNHVCRRQSDYWWWWLCPVCERRCRYLYPWPDGDVIQCRVCWKLPYRSQGISSAQRRLKRDKKIKSPRMINYLGLYESYYWQKDGRRTCYIPPKPPSGWIPEDLLKKYYEKQNSVKCESGLKHYT